MQNMLTLLLKEVRCPSSITESTCRCVILKMDLYGNSILAGIFNKIHFTLFSWCLLASCVVIFPIRCDLSDFPYPEFLIGDASKQLTFTPGGGGYSLTRG